ncbi:MAG: hypothetical protein OHK0017_04440 [Patescibacteria group bacterium]
MTPFLDPTFPPPPNQLQLKLSSDQILSIGLIIVSKLIEKGVKHETVLELDRNKLVRLLFTNFKDLCQLPPVDLNLSCEYLLAFLETFSNAEYCHSILGINLNPFRIKLRANDGHIYDLPLKIKGISQSELKIEARPEVLASLLKLFQDVAPELVSASKFNLFNDSVPVSFGFKSRYYDRYKVENNHNALIAEPELTGVKMLIPGKLLFKLIMLLSETKLADELTSIEFIWNQSQIALNFSPKKTVILDIESLDLNGLSFRTGWGSLIFLRLKLSKFVFSQIKKLVKIF